ncbi:MAG: hypothetical protein KGZ50_05740 [Peptococcaceae bacterium]|nr:hypothetical protein [Peptococcaceae bacterium]
MGNDLRQAVEERLRTLIYQFERMKLAEYVALMNNPWRLFWVNFLAGMGRGLGFAFGGSLLAAALLYLLSQIAILNLPLISDVIAEIVRLVRIELDR